MSVPAKLSLPGNIVQTTWFSRLAEAFQTPAIHGFDFTSGPHPGNRQPATETSNSLSRLVFTTPTAPIPGLGMEIKQHKSRWIDTDDDRAVERLEPFPDQAPRRALATPSTFPPPAQVPRSARISRVLMRVVSAASKAGATALEQCGGGDF